MPWDFCEDHFRKFASEAVKEYVQRFSSVVNSCGTRSMSKLRGRTSAILFWGSAEECKKQILLTWRLMIVIDKATKKIKKIDSKERGYLASPRSNGVCLSAFVSTPASALCCHRLNGRVICLLFIVMAAAGFSLCSYSSWQYFDTFAYFFALPWLIWAIAIYWSARPKFLAWHAFVVF